MHLQDNTPNSPSPFRVGSVPYLNGVPLTRGLEDQVIYATPAELARLLRADKLEAALVSVTEVLFHDRYDILDGVSISSLGEVKSVLLAHRGPLEAAREIHCDPASLTSVNLLRVLLAEKGLRPEFKTLASYDPGSMPDYALLIGNPALDFLHAQTSHGIWDLGAAWYEMTRLPFVYAVWALRRDAAQPPLRQLLRDAQKLGLQTLDLIIRERQEYSYEFRKDYLGWHVHYYLGQAERDGVRRFGELLRKHGLGPVYEPRYVA